MTTVTFAMKKFFFDRAKVSQALDKASRKALSKAGAFVMTSAKRSLRRRKKASSPGQTPSIHSNDKFASLKNILFAYNPVTKSVIVGPVGFGRKHAPKTLEKGGSTTVPIKRVAGRRATPAQAAAFKRRLKAGQIMRKPRGTKTVTIAARPFMGPALQREYPKFPGLWANSV